MPAFDFKCHGCGHAVRVRSIGREHGQSVVLVTCPKCGLTSTYDAVWVQLESPKPG